MSNKGTVPVEYLTYDSFDVTSPFTASVDSKKSRKRFSCPNCCLGLVLGAVLGGVAAAAGVWFLFVDPTSCSKGTRR